MSEHTRFVAPARVIAGLTAVSRVLGLVREMTYSYFFGIDPLFSSFRVAFMIPNLARRLFGEGAMASAFVPVFTEVHRNQGTSRARDLAGTALTLLGLALAALSLLVMLGVGIGYVLTGSETLLLTVIMMPYMLLICMAGFSGGMLNALNRFAIPAAAPVLLNVFLIGTLLVGGMALRLPLRSLIFLVAVAVVVAGAAQFGSQVLDLIRAKCSPRLNFRWRDPDLRRILLLLVPMLIGLSAMQFNVLADSLIALYLVPEGRGPAVLGYAHMLYHLPQGVFGIALATAIFPLLSARAAERDHAGLARAFESGMRVSLYVALPASAGLILLASPIVNLLYQHKGGKFDPAAAHYTARTLVAYCVGLWAFSVQPILARAFYALQDARTPVRVGLVTVGLNFFLSLALVFPLEEAGIALATAVTSAMQVIWLALALNRRLPELQWRPVASSIARSLAGVLAMALFLWAVQRPGLLGGSHALLLLAVAIPGGIVIFAGTTLLLRSGEPGELLSR